MFFNFVETDVIIVITKEIKINLLPLDILYPYVLSFFLSSVLLKFNHFIGMVSQGSGGNESGGGNKAETKTSL